MHSTERALTAIDFFKTRNPDNVMRSVRSLAFRSQPVLVATIVGEPGQLPGITGLFFNHFSGALIGLLTVVIRYYSGWPEGVMYASLLANAATPLIENTGGRESPPTHDQRFSSSVR